MVVDFRDAEYCYEAKQDSIEATSSYEAKTTQMRSLFVKDFSCIDEVEMYFGALTVLIGPQASGKSVLSKLVYFFYSLINDQYLFIQDSQEFSAFRAHVRSKFNDWFPVSAWGSKKFSIEFRSGEYEVRLTRGSRKSRMSESIRVWLPQFVEDLYNEGLARIEKTEKSRDEFELFMRARSVITKEYMQRLGDDFVQRQLFVPAGRSFFTSVGKAVAAFDQARILDPITLIFGRQFASIRDRQFHRWPNRPGAKLLTTQTMQELFGGELKIDRQKEYIQARDGRQIPFSALSSGQQELLPLWMVLDNWLDYRPDVRSLLYIEEPEAHLFPSAQSALVELLASICMNAQLKLDLIVTTHSPYVLAKLNNLVKAGELSAKHEDKLNSQIDAIVPKRAWLKPNTMKAYAIHERKIMRVDEADGLINAEYLDSVSEVIAREFSSLLELEVKNASC